jgi:hypothetical protein
MRVEQQHQRQQSEHDTYTYVRTIMREIQQHEVEYINWIRRRQMYD